MYRDPRGALHFSNAPTEPQYQYYVPDAAKPAPRAGNTMQATASGSGSVAVPQAQATPTPAGTPTPLTMEGLRPKGIVRMDRNGITEYDSEMRPITTPRAKQDAKGRRDAFVEAHRELSSQLRTAIVAGKPLVGMTSEQVLACCGAPVNHQSSESSEGHLERWQYGFPGDELPMMYLLQGDPTDFHEFCYLSFLDGLLVSWECPR